MLNGQLSRFCPKMPDCPDKHSIKDWSRDKDQIKCSVFGCKRIVPSTNWGGKCDFHLKGIKAQSQSHVRDRSVEPKHSKSSLDSTNRKRRRSDDEDESEDEDKHAAPVDDQEEGERSSHDSSDEAPVSADN